MTSSRAGSNLTHSSIGDESTSVRGINVKDSSAESSDAQVNNMVGWVVHKTHGAREVKGVVQSYNSETKTYEVLYRDSKSEKVTEDSLVTYLSPTPPEDGEQMQKDHNTGNNLPLVAFAPKSQKRGGTEKKSSAIKRGGAKNPCPPRLAGGRGSRHSTKDDEDSEMVLLQCSTGTNEALEGMNLRRSTRKRKELGYTYYEETSDEDEFFYVVDDDDDEEEPDYPLPPLIQVPWLDMEEEEPPKGPMKGICTSKSYKGRRTKKHWASLRISASTYHRDGQKKKTGASQGLGA